MDLKTETELPDFVSSFYSRGILEEWPLRERCARGMPQQSNLPVAPMGTEAAPLAFHKRRRAPSLSAPALQGAGVLSQSPQEAEKQPFPVSPSPDCNSKHPTVTPTVI